MEKLSKTEINALRSIQEDGRWDAIEHVGQILMEEFNNDKVGGIDAYTELRSLHIQQGKREGLKRFFEVLEKQVLDNQ